MFDQAECVGREQHVLEGYDGWSGYESSSSDGFWSGRLRSTPVREGGSEMSLRRHDLDECQYRDPVLKTFAYWHAATIRERWCGRVVTPGTVEEDETMSGMSDDDRGMEPAQFSLKRRRIDEGNCIDQRIQPDGWKRQRLYDDGINDGDLFVSLL